MARKLANWLEGYLSYTKRGESPHLYKVWSALSALSAVTRRQTFIEWEGLLFPNIYVVLIGPPGVRKSTATRPAAELLRRVGVPLSSDAVTREALIGEMDATKVAAVGMPAKYDATEICSLSTFSSELAVFMKHVDREFITLLTDWFDCQAPWRYTTKKSGANHIPSVYYSLIGGITPENLSQVFPVEAIQGGFMSRCMLVHGAANAGKTHFPQKTASENKLFALLENDLAHIGQLQGEFSRTSAWDDEWYKWYDSHDSIRFKHKNLAYYTNRRPIHLLKLNMLMSLACRDDLMLDVDVFQASQALLAMVEKEMARVFDGYGRLDYSSVVPQVCQALLQHRKIGHAQLFSMFVKDLTPVEFSNILLALKQNGDVTNYKEDGKNIWEVRDGITELRVGDN